MKTRMWRSGGNFVLLYMVDMGGTVRRTHKNLIKPPMKENPT